MNCRIIRYFNVEASLYHDVRVILLCRQVNRIQAIFLSSLFLPLFSSSAMLIFIFLTGFNFLRSSLFVIETLIMKQRNEHKSSQKISSRWRRLADYLAISWKSLLRRRKRASTTFLL